MHHRRKLCKKWLHYAIIRSWSRRVPGAAPNRGRLLRLKRRGKSRLTTHGTKWVHQSRDLGDRDSAGGRCRTGVRGPRMDARPRGSPRQGTRHRHRPHDPPPGLSPDAAEVEVREVLDSIGDTCPECPPQCRRAEVSPQGRVRRDRGCIRCPTGENGALLGEAQARVEKPRPAGAQTWCLDEEEKIED
jgi:hypothetical protein